jgi:hypothetical protein
VVVRVLVDESVSLSLEVGDAMFCP